MKKKKKKSLVHQLFAPKIISIFVSKYPRIFVCPCPLGICRKQRWKKKRKKPPPFLAKIIDGVRRKRDPFEKRHWYENEYRLWPSPPTLTFASALLLIYPRGVTVCSSASGGLWRMAVQKKGRRGKEEKEERGERGKERKEKKERDPCGIGRVEYVKRITRSSRTESPDQLHNGATETDALQPPPRAPLALSRPKASPLSPPLPLSPSLLASSRSPFRKVTIEQRVEPLLCGRSNYYALWRSLCLSTVTPTESILLKL